MKHLLIVRHGNTFLPGELPRRVGGRTDLPLTESARARGAARNLRANDLIPDSIFAAPLARTRQTAELIRDELGLSLPVLPAPAFVEIDYGPDENQPEDAVRRRLGLAAFAREGRAAPSSEEELLRRGEEALALWNTEAVLPEGWLADPQAIALAWREFAGSIAEGQKVLLVSSNGIIRFAPHLLPDAGQKNFTRQHSLKVATGALCVFAYERGDWHCACWNMKPELEPQPPVA